MLSQEHQTSCDFQNHLNQSRKKTMYITSLCHYLHNHSLDDEVVLDGKQLSKM